MIGTFPMAGIGFGIGGTLISSHCLAILTVTGRQVDHWREVAGYLQDLDISEYRTIKSKLQPSIMVKTPRIRARYSYQFGAAKFTGMNVSIMDFCPTIGLTDSNELADMLKRSYSGDKSVRVFVNPNEPTEAVLTKSSYGSPVGGNILLFLLSVGLLVAEYFPTVPDYFHDNATGADWVAGAGMGLGLYLLALYLRSSRYRTPPFAE